MKAPDSSQRLRLVVIGLAAATFAGIMLWIALRDPLHASPTATRHHAEVLFTKSWDDYTSEQAPVSFPSAAAFSRATALHYPTGVLVNVRRGAMGDNLLPTPATAIRAGANGVAALPGGGTLRLAAYALSVPHAEDPSDPAPREDLVFRQPGRSTPLSADELDALGIPAEERSVSKSLRLFPMLRLVLTTGDLPFARVGEWRIFDGRTQAMITRGVQQREAGSCRILDGLLGIWHDAPVVLAVELPCGGAVETPVPLEEGFETQPAPHLRFQLTALDDGKVSDVESPNNGLFFETRARGTNPEGTVFVYRIFPGAWAEHTLIRTRHGEETEDLYLQPTEISWLNSRWPRSDLDEVTLVHLPNKARAVFEIPELPEMPNPRAVSNLFDVNIPRLVLDFPEGTGDSVLGDILIDVVAGATELTPSLLTTKPLTGVPDDYLPKRFENVTPRQLVAEYQRFAEDPYLHVDRTEHQIRFHRPEPWTLRLKQWWYFNAPDWAK